MDESKVLEKVMLLDGGLSNDLNNRVNFDVHAEPLWTAKALHTDPEAIVQTHLTYLEAGADIIETASYQATIEGFQEFMGLDSTTSYNLIKNSGLLAKKAVDIYISQDSSREKNLPQVAGSIGPYGVYLRDGSEYTGAYANSISKVQIEAMHVPRIKALAEANVDILIVETMPLLSEVEIILNAIQSNAPMMKTWVSFSIKDGNPFETAGGDSLENAYKRVASFSQVEAFGINCCSPKDIEGFLKHVKTFEPRPKLKLVVYPNSGQQWIRGQGWINEEVPTLSTFAKIWMDLGANIIGGCCQVGAKEIMQMKSIVDNRNESEKDKITSHN